MDCSVTNEEFSRFGYAVVSDVVSKDLLEIAFRYYLSYINVPGYYNVTEVNKAFDRYADALSEALIPLVQSRVEAVAGRKLLPTYSFARIYTTESELTKHVDRGACEISATLTVGYRNVAQLWPILVESAGEEKAIELDVGSALVYRGMEVPHWRNKLERGIWCQLFFHFVDADGKLTDLHYDGRGRLGPFDISGYAS
ncbi:hypothetical protein [Silanimonas sp.]|uniref:hypothetical protein n=1 Tax=Silanimonas sp. TaxID=1929290 RepID=UPI001BC045D3|nr:hypothetical protein [Silanimonas sp.]MBS3895272.1 hypothetical protein [Silanimonas sp.]